MNVNNINLQHMKSAIVPAPPANGQSTLAVGQNGDLLLRGHGEAQRQIAFTDQIPELPRNSAVTAWFRPGTIRINAQTDQDAPSGPVSVVFTNASTSFFGSPGDFFLDEGRLKAGPNVHLVRLFLNIEGTIHVPVPAQLTSTELRVGFGYPGLVPGLYPDVPGVRRAISEAIGPRMGVSSDGWHRFSHSLSLIHDVRQTLGRLDFEINWGVVHPSAPTMGPFAASLQFSIETIIEKVVF